VVFTAFVAATYWVMSPDTWSLYNEYWLWSIIVASLMLGVARLFFRHRQADSGTGS
jgi:hypothetical protein